MASFKDSKGREWTLAITVGDLDRVQADANTDLEKVLENKAEELVKLLSSPRRLVSVAFCLCEDQAKAASVSPEDFGRSITGEVLTQLANAFLDAVTDFFHDRRETIQEWFAAMRRVGTAADQELRTEFQNLDAAKVIAVAKAASSKPVTESAEKPESIPEASPSAS